MTSSIVLPAPRPPSSSPFQRLPSTAPSLAPRRGEYSYFPFPVEGEEAPPTVDELTAEINNLDALVASIASNCERLTILRNGAVRSTWTPLETLQQLSTLTTFTGRTLLSLSSSLPSLSARIALLSTLVASGRAAALPFEVAQLEERLAVVSLEAEGGMKRIRKGAWEEVDAREGTRRRVEERVRRENGGLGKREVGIAVDGALRAAEGRVATLDLNSYAGRVAAENPFTELATLLDEAKAAGGLGGDLLRTPTRASTASDTTTLVNSASQHNPFASSIKSGIEGDQYGKLDGGEGQEELLAAQKGTLLGDGDLEKAVEHPNDDTLSTIQKMKRDWKDYAVRTGVVVVVVGVLVGVFVYAGLSQANQTTSDSITTSSASASATSTSS